MLRNSITASKDPPSAHSPAVCLIYIGVAIISPGTPDLDQVVLKPLGNGIIGGQANAPDTGLPP
ncbi:MAG: hypothetical protein MUW57_05030 [Pseudomonas sp.]|nr:hypothetical protein [Pseudomonas sp.]